MRLTEKRKSQIFDAVHEEIMSARIRIAKILNGRQDGIPVDDILSDLCIKAPQKAIDSFKKA